MGAAAESELELERNMSKKSAASEGHDKHLV